MRRPRRLLLQFRLAIFLFIAIGICVLLGVFGPNLFRAVQEIGIGNTIVFGLLIGFPLVFLAFCFSDMFTFFRDPRIVKHRQLPDTIEIDDIQASSDEDSSCPPKKKRWIFKRPSWFHSRWIGPGGYR